MPFKLSRTRDETVLRPDFVIEEWFDKEGNGWRLALSIKITNQIAGIHELSIKPTANGYPLTQSVLRQIPLAAIEREAFESAKEALEALRAFQAGPRSGRPFNAEELQKIAEIYLHAKNARIPVQKAVSEHFGIAVSTAAKQIMAARQRGYLPPARKDED